MNGHTPKLGRVRLGRKTWGTGGDQYGTTVRCGCEPNYREQWHQQVNEAPSSGGTGEAMARWWAHVAEHLAALPGHQWSDLSLRVRRQFTCEGYTAKGFRCSAHATYRYGIAYTPATVVLCTTHARMAGCPK